jgi:hypothetical protein
MIAGYDKERNQEQKKTKLKTKQMNESFEMVYVYTNELNRNKYSS